MSEQQTNHNRVIQIIKEPNGNSRIEKHSAWKGKKKKSVNGMNSTLGMVKEKTSELEERSVEFF